MANTVWLIISLNIPLFTTIGSLVSSKSKLGNSLGLIPFKLNSVLSVLTISLYPSITSIEISVFGNFLIISTIYLPPITILPSSLVLVNLSFDINDLIDTSVSLAYKYKPSSLHR